MNRNPRRQHVLYLWLAFFHLAARCSWALDTQPSLAQYSRQQWSAEDGFRLGQISSIVQTPDGYVWIGGENGLVSFNGDRFRAFPTTGQSAITHVLGLAVDGKGELWVWMQGASILRQTSAGFVNVTNELGFPDEITVVSSGMGGRLLFSTLGQQLFAYLNGQVSKIGLTKISPALALAETRDGHVWVGTRDYGLARLTNGIVVPLSDRASPRKINCLLNRGERALWVGTDEGLFFWDGSQLERIPGPVGFSGTQVFSMVEDRDGLLWCGTDKGLFRVLESASKRRIASGPLLNDSVSALFEDREGGLWIGAAGTLQRWKDYPFRPLESGSAALDAPLFADEHGTVWLASSNGGLYRVNQSGASEVWRTDVFGRDVIYSIGGRNGDIWAGRRDGGITHLRQTPSGISARTYTRLDGLAQNTVLSVFESPHGTVWAGSLNAGLSRFEEGRWTTFTTADGLPANAISAITEDQAGVLWIGTPGGLASLSRGRWRTYTSQDGLPANDISFLLPDTDSDGSPIVWVGTTKGLAVVRSGKIGSLAPRSEILQEPVLGLSRDLVGTLWFSTPDHLARVNRQQLLDEKNQFVDIRLYGRRDGIEQPGASRRLCSLVTDATGGIWAATKGGLRVSNPAYMGHGAVSTIVHIESIVGDNGEVDMRSLIVPVPQRRIVFNFNGLNFDARERVRYRYQLEGYDKNWSDPGESRQAVYTHLDPAAYRFRVIATDSEGQWNSREASVSLRIEPAVWQTWWFRSACFGTALLLSWFAYRVRVRQISGEHLLVFEGRVAERMRIARDLHDTLLQSFHGLLLRFQAVRDMLPEEPDTAARALDAAIGQASAAITEGRDAVQALRGDEEYDEFGDSVATLDREFRSETPQAQQPDFETSYRVLVEGTPRRLHPVVRDELYRIAREAVRNAFRHAHAKQIELDIRFDERGFRLRVRDNGGGIDPQVLRSGQRKGHYGLPGMRERAIDIGGQFEIWSDLRSGTEIEVTIPGAIAYVRFEGPSNSVIQ